MARYYIDTSIWMDVLEDRKGYGDEPLGEYALKLFSMIRSKKDVIVISDILMKELLGYYSLDQVNGMLRPFFVLKIFTSKKQDRIAIKIAERRNLPKGDVLHAILAKDSGSVLVTRDKHFEKLVDICNYYKPEELI